MPSDPKQYRLNALRCAELAASAKAQELKTTLLDLSKTWQKLAEELERNHAIVDDDTDYRKPA